MDVVAIRAALRVPAPQHVEPEPSQLLAAIAAYSEAVRRHTRAETEASFSRRPSTTKAVLKSAEALERAHAHLTAELRLIGVLVDDGAAAGAPAPPADKVARLRLCP